MNVFLRLFDGGARGNSKPKLEKIVCILNYFKEIGRLEGEGSLISFERKSGGNPPDWTISKEQMSMVHVDHRNRIEDARESLQIDFANRLVGESKAFYQFACA